MTKMLADSREEELFLRKIAAIDESCPLNDFEVAQARARFAVRAFRGRWTRLRSLGVALISLIFGGLAFAFGLEVSRRSNEEEVTSPREVPAILRGKLSRTPSVAQSEKESPAGEERSEPAKGVVSLDSLEERPREVRSEVAERATKGWPFVQKSLDRGDIEGARRELSRMRTNSVGAARDSASLSLAQLELGQKNDATAIVLLRELVASATDPVVSARARLMLRTLGTE